MKKLLIAAALAVACGPAQSMTGNDFTDLCDDPVNGKVACRSMVIGFLSGIIAQSDFTDSRPVICLKEGYRFTQMADIATLYIKENPKRRDEDLSALLVDAWQDWNPC